MHQLVAPNQQENITPARMWAVQFLDEGGNPSVVVNQAHRQAVKKEVARREKVKRRHRKRRPKNKKKK